MALFFGLGLLFIFVNSVLYLRRCDRKALREARTLDIPVTVEPPRSVLRYCPRCDLKVESTAEFALEECVFCHGPTRDHDGPDDEPTTKRAA